MSIIKLNNKRDFRRSRDTDKYYLYLKNKLNIDNKHAFLLSYKYAIFKNHDGKKIDNPIHIGQISTINEKEIELMVISLLSEKYDEDILNNGDYIISQIEEYANTGIRLIYDRFIKEEKNEVYVFEDIITEIKLLL